MDLAAKIKKNIQKSIYKIGWDVHRFTLTSNPHLQLAKAMNAFDIDTVFDVGVNKGQFSTHLWMFGYKGKIVRFEPLSDTYSILLKNSESDEKWKVHTRSAIGDFDGKITINVAGNSESSLALPMLENHISAAENSAYIGAEKVEISQLDSLSASYLNSSSRLFVKIDTQAFEWNVLDGAKDTLKNAQGVSCELSLILLYEGQRLWLEIIHRLENEGFTLWSIDQGFVGSRNARTLQLDANFFRLNF